MTTEVADARATETRDRQVSRVIVIEGCANAAVLSMKLIAQRSQQVGKLLYYPCVVIFLMALARL